jgi:hypothetical protein
MVNCGRTNSREPLGFIDCSPCLLFSQKMGSLRGLHDQNAIRYITIATITKDFATVIAVISTNKPTASFNLSHVPDRYSL